MPIATPSSTRTALLVALIAPVLWGTSWIGISEFMPPDQPLLAATLRALPAGLLLLALVRRLPSGRWWWRAGVLGTLNFGLFFALLTVAAYRVPGGVGATTGALQPLMVAALGVPLLATRVDGRQLFAGIAGIVGVALLVLGPDTALDGIGIAAAIAAVASMALGLVLLKRWHDPDVDALTTTAWQLTAGGLLLAPATLLLEGTPPAPTPDTWLATLWVGLLCTGFANWMWFLGIEQLAATQASFLTLVGPIVAAVLGWSVLGESLTFVQLLGAAIALGSVAAGSLVGARAGTASRSTPRGSRHAPDTAPRRWRSPPCHPPCAP